MFVRNDDVVQLIIVIAFVEKVLGLFEELEVHLGLELLVEQTDEFFVLLVGVALEGVVDFDVEILLVLFALQISQSRFDVTVQFLHAGDYLGLGEGGELLAVVVVDTVDLFDVLPLSHLNLLLLR